VSPASSRRLRQLASIDVAGLRSVTERRAKALDMMGIETVFDLLTTYPRRYVDRTKRVDLSDLTIGEEVAIFGEVDRVASRRTRQGRALVELTVADESGEIQIVFFNQAWRERQLAVGTQALFFAKVTEYRGRRQMTNPVVDVLVGAGGLERDATRVGRVVPIYPASGKAGLTSWEIGGFVTESLDRAGTFLDPVPAPVLARHDLVDRTSAFRMIHLPEDVDEWPRARRRLAFDELFRLQMLLELRRRRVDADALGIAHPARAEELDAERGASGELADGLVAMFLRSHRFDLTGAQRRVLGEIFDDLAGPTPMHRLLQGDVGSGKTTVALAALLAVIEGGRQGAVMAPTEVLAEQHLLAMRHDVAGLEVADASVLAGRRPLQVHLLTGALRAKERKVVLQGLAAGTVDVVVGTHALLTEDVEFRRLGLVVIDEQHRFGVEQRATLRAKGRSHSAEGRDPDLLVMTATPIPRTAAMVVFGDLEISTLDEMPPGREPVRTIWLRSGEVHDAWATVRDEVRAGRRAFVICPLIEGSERVVAASAVEERDRLVAGELAGLRVGLLHGQVSDKEAVMDQFRRGDLDVLVATVVVEVGVDVPEATVIVIEDAWRFGLAQLHQLRGRVGRGAHRGTCYLLGEPPSPEGERRLEAMVASTDGFELAEVDLELRGEGTLLGARQRGRSDLRLASLRQDRDLLEWARAAAAEVADDAATMAGDGDLVDELRLFVDDEEADYLFKS
jgi:ATP-dependent DNA helicase RecG